MRTLRLICFLATSAMISTAHGEAQYACVNEPLRVDIPAQDLGKALAIFSQQTKCPVSLEVTEVANTDVSMIPSYVVSGRMTPKDALETLLSASPLKVEVIRQGFSIYMPE